MSPHTGWPYTEWQRVGSVRVGSASGPVHAGRFGPVQPSSRFVPVHRLSRFSWLAVSAGSGGSPCRNRRVGSVQPCRFG
eukprot:9725745-Alexandrium_andersonii.AAC.1